MSIIRIAGVALIACALSVAVKQIRPEFGIYVPIAAAVIIFVYAVSELCGIINTLTQRLETFGMDKGYLAILMKSLGLSYTAQTAADICKDAGESALSNKVEMCGKVMILSLCIPVIFDVLDMINEVIALI